MTPTLESDVSRSGLLLNDLNARELGPPERAATATGQAIQGYVIPYYDIKGKPIPFYRVRLLNAEPKYKQPTGTTNFVYFPPLFAATFGAMLATEEKPYILITEGEKKAAKACKEGIPCIAFGGVESWRSRTILLPEGATLEKAPNSGAIKVKLKSNTYLDAYDAQLAVGLPEIIQTCLKRDICLIIAYDCDEQGIKFEVQRAAASLGCELRFQGIPLKNIRQLILPSQINGSGKKVGLDDFIVHKGPKALEDLISQTMAARTAFPRHPNLKILVSTKLQSKLTRKEAQFVSLSILSELDASGNRLVSTATNEPYYFDSVNKSLMPAAILHRSGEPYHETAFGRHLYRKFGINIGDSKVLNWLASQYTGEDPLDPVDPKRVITSTQEGVALQLSNSKFAFITEKGIEICDNGSKGLLFEQDQVEPVNIPEMMKHYEQQQSNPLEPWWVSVLDDVNLIAKTEHSKVFAALLFYCSPWLLRWKGTQLPIELIIGEANSGKSSLCNLRMNILTGRSVLRNAPNDIRDWYTSIAGTGGIHITDNVQFTNKDLRQRLSDEMCRIVTAPSPTIEMRKLYTTATQLQIPIEATFALTAIQQPFFNTDLLQRSAVIELETLQSGHDSDWVKHQMMKYGGRSAWIAHHLLVLHKFLKGIIVDGLWDTEYQASHRLAHYEQSLIVMAEIFGINSDWIQNELSGSTQITLSEADWAIEGLKVFAEQHGNIKGYRFSSTDIANWALGHEEFSDNPQLTNVRRVGRYIYSHRALIQSITGIAEAGRRGNKMTYIISRGTKNSS